MLGERLRNYPLSAISLEYHKVQWAQEKVSTVQESLRKIYFGYRNTGGKSDPRGISVVCRDDVGLDGKFP